MKNAAFSTGRPVTNAPKPLFADPVYDGAADPSVIWNSKEKKWYMLYTNRRAKDMNAVGVTWVHGTRIGIAVSEDGSDWKYLDTADIRFRPDTNYTFWAPEVIANGSDYHMYLTYVPGVFKDWDHPRQIVHLKSTDLIRWDYINTTTLANDKVIDACVMKMPDNTWRMWYNNERDRKSIYYADSKDLVSWTDKGKAVGDRGGEGPKVFRWKEKYWMLVDVWAGMAIYSSDDLTNWTRQEERILEHPGKGKDDQAIGGHADILVNNGKAYVYYFTHPGRVGTEKKWPDNYETRRSVIQVAELDYADGKISADRDKNLNFKLLNPNEK
ncbi:MAG: glycosyl hydrolase [Gemmatimonadaceae bacterium]|nr:glycosyl hydrolase [Chitinophagaceae bacterium]